MSVSRPGRPRAHASIEDAYRAHAIPTTDGHMQWTGPNYGHGRAPMVQHVKERESAYRVAFRLHHGRAPEGMLKPVCGVRGCVAGTHLEDAVMRQARNLPRPRLKPGPKGVPVAEILAAIGEGLSDTAIGRALRTNPKRVKRIRAELGLPKPARTGLTLEQAWSARTRPVDGGHLAWTGSRHLDSPSFRHAGRLYMGRRVAFQLAHQREPVGRVFSGCGWPECVHPRHVEDQPMRNQYNAIFGEAAA